MGLPSPQGCFVPSLVEIGPVEDFKNFVTVFLLFPYYLPLEKILALHLIWIVPSLVKIGSVLWRRKKNSEKIWTITITMDNK